MRGIEDVLRKVSDAAKVKELVKESHEDIKGKQDALKRLDREYPFLSTLLMALVVFFSGMIGVFNAFVYYIEAVPPDKLVYIVVAVVAGLITYFTSVSTRDHEISKLRCEWLDNLKEEVVLFSGNVNDSLYYLALGESSKEAPQSSLHEWISSKVMSESFQGSAQSVAKSYQKIRLHLQRDDDAKPESVLLNKIGGLNAEFWSICKDAPSVSSYEEANEVVNKCIEVFTSKSGAILDDTRKYVESEWGEIKRGGFGFRVIRTMVFSFCAYVIGFYICFFVQHHLDVSEANGEKISVIIEFDEKGDYMSQGK